MASVNVGVIEVGCLIPSNALMKVSAWHKAQGDLVEVIGVQRELGYVPAFSGTPDILYASKPFDFTPDYAYWPECEIVKGGTGYDPTAHLPMGDLDSIMPDYDLLGCTYAMGRVTRGCPRACDFCMVKDSDGTRPRQVAEVSDWYAGQGVIRLMDDNLAAIPDVFMQTCADLKATGAKVIWEALDVRLLTDEMCAALVSVKRQTSIKFAWDKLADEADVLAGLRRMKRAYPSMHDVMVYVLTNYGTTQAEDEYRCETLRGMGIAPFVMIYDKANAPDLTRRYARYVNRKELFKSCTFAEFAKELVA